ncbi:nitrilotriacetate monooxygenase [Rhodobacteraceae bacterium WD3A24]|nr:nitrilotriacetate monooxygenase [Rhodobacteraceae bacterium WD3A24]
MANFATGVAVVTTRDTDGTPYGVTVNSFNSVSLDPPLVLWSLGLDAFSYPVFHRAAGFAVNLLADDQQDICRLFASRQERRFDRVAWQAGPLGLPLLDGAVARFSCVFWARYPGGDHEIMVGRVISCTRGPGRPLLYSQGRFGSAAPG